MKKKTPPLTEREIDDTVVAEADDDAAWGKPIRARKAKLTSAPENVRAAIARLKAFQESRSLAGLSIREMIEEGRKY